MIETWRDSWFEEGMRVFYLVPRSLVDRELRLSVQPAPARIARVFVGREEILSPYMRDRLGRRFRPETRRRSTNSAVPGAVHGAVKATAAPR